VVIAALVALFTGVTPGALADQEVVAGPGAATTGYANPKPTMAQGEKLTFTNNDIGIRHDVTAKKEGSDGKPLFKSDTIGSGSAFVEGSQYLTTGTYDFYCTIHPGTMTGVLTVTSDGTPKPRPGSGGGGGSSGGGGNAGGGGNGSGAGGGPGTAAPKKAHRRKHARKRARGHHRHKRRHRSHA
jgi:plastocyanin